MSSFLEKRKTKRKATAFAAKTLTQNFRQILNNPANPVQKNRIPSIPQEFQNPTPKSHE